MASVKGTFARILMGTPLNGDTYYCETEAKIISPVTALWIYIEPPMLLLGLKKLVCCSVGLSLIPRNYRIFILN